VQSSAKYEHVSLLIEIKRLIVNNNVALLYIIVEKYPVFNAISQGKPVYTCVEFTVLKIDKTIENRKIKF